MSLPSTHYSMLLALADGHSRDRAWFAFDARYRDVIIAWCRKRGLQQSGAEDVAQEILLKLFDSLPAFDPAKGTFRGWLKSVVNNAVTDRYRREARDPARPWAGTTDYQRWLENVASPEASAELSEALEERGRSAAAEVFERVQERVSDSSWRAFAAVMVEGKAAGEVAREFGLQVGSVYKIVYRVKKIVTEECLNAALPSDAPPVSGPSGPAEIS